ncbi:DUF397 domain-containing protein [Kitasatospora sp. GP30]|nr:DUF397 domain-containing protein [Kitasatospora sp. GP30]
MSTPSHQWFKSSYSGQNGECIEVRRSEAGLDVRDSKDPQGPILAFPHSAWRAFVTSVHDGTVTTPDGHCVP